MIRRPYPLIGLIAGILLLSAFLAAQSPGSSPRNGMGAPPSPGLANPPDGCPMPPGSMPGGGPHAGGMPPSPFSLWRDARLTAELQLTTDQITALKTKEATFIQTAQTIRDNQDQAQVDLDRAFAQQPIDAANVRQAATQLAGFRTQFFSLLTAAQLEVRGILTSQQRQKLPVAGPGSPGGRGPDGGSGMSSPFGLWRDYRSIERLGLTDSQLTVLKEKDAAFIQSARTLGESMGAARQVLDAALTQNPVNEAQVQQAVAQIAELGLQGLLLETNGRLELLSILTSEQASLPRRR